ncbi:magnesium and cobalt transport protein CorA [soil metagenome]
MTDGPPRSDDARRDGLPPRLPLAGSLAAPVRRGATRMSGGRTRAPGGTAEGAGPVGIVDCALYENGFRRGGVLPLETALETAHEASGRAPNGQSAAEQGASFVWIGLHEPTSEQFHTVATEFALHPLAVEDAVHAHQRPKLETYGDIVFVVFKTVRYVDSAELIEIGELMLFLGPDFVVSVRHGGGSALAEVRRELEARPELLRAGPSAVLYAVADRIVDDYTLAADGVAVDIDEIETQVFSGDNCNYAERIYKLKREVLAFLRGVGPLAVPVERLARGDVPSLDPRTTAYFRDVHDHLLRVTECIEGFNELLNGVLNANVAGVTVRQNEDMRKITAWVAILAWITMIAGIYGMNFDHMPELHWMLGYPFALALMLAGAVWLYRAFRRNRWL